MVTEEKINHVLMRYRLGIVLIWLGVLTWLPFLALRMAGERPSLFWYLPFHLLGVIGGSRLRSVARREMGLPSPKKNWLRLMGHASIYMGILVWVPYFYTKVTAHVAPDITNYLPYHLLGVFCGITLLAISYLISRRNDVKV